MGRVHPAIDDRLAEWIDQQHLFFVATAPSAGGHVNLSPKGYAGSFRVLGPLEVAYLDYTGSGIETTAHLADDGRIALMFCAFEGPPKIVRLHGQGRTVSPGDHDYDQLLDAFPTPRRGLRSIVHVRVDRVSQSCGYGVPFMSYERERDTMDKWLAGKTDDDLDVYRAQKNAVSIDGLPGLIGPSEPVS